jgi:hypothetical protein
VSATENAIDDAIRAHLDAEGETGVVAGWVTLVAIVDHDDGDNTSGLHTIYPGGDMPWPMALGIVEMGRLRLQAGFTAGRD